MAKALGGGMPIGAICAREEVAKAFTMGSHGTTFGGHPVCCAVLFYALVIVAVGLVLTGPEILASENGTGLVTAFSVITDHACNYKLTVFSYKLIPKYAILDADFLTTAPARIAAACGIDAMVHAMSHPVSAYFNVPHGVANAILLPTIMEFNALADQGKYKKIYAFIANHEVPEDFEPIDLVALLRELNVVLGIPATLHDAGVTAESFAAMADDAMKSGNIAVNPRATTKADILALYQKAL